MRLKTAPRVIIALVILGAAAWGLNNYLDKRPAAPVVPAEEAVVVPTPVPEAQVVQPPAQVAQPQVQPQPQAPAPAPQPRPKTRDDAGMDALLGGK
jgi:outer membrane biosynthesis protein TonB